MSHPKKGTEAYRRERERERERRAKKREEKRLAMQQAEIEKAPESAMQSEPDPDMWTPFMVQMRRQQREHSK